MNTIKIKTTWKYGLYYSTGKENVKQDRLREPDKTRYEIYDALKTSVPRCRGNPTPENLLRLEDIFHYNRDNDSISIVRKRVETYERLVKEQAEKIERARMNANDAERLQREVETVKNR